MFRTAASRSIQSFRTPSIASTVQRAAFRTAAQALVRPGTLSVALRKPIQKSLVRYETTYQKADFVKERDVKGEEAFGKTTLQPVPSIVSTDSSIHPVTGEVGGVGPEEDVDMTASIRSDFVS
jgi:hypothetical protein